MPLNPPLARLSLSSNSARRAALNQASTSESQSSMSRGLMMRGWGPSAGGGPPGSGAESKWKSPGTRLVSHVRVKRQPAATTAADRRIKAHSAPWRRHPGWNLDRRGCRKVPRQRPPSPAQWLQRWYPRNIKGKIA